MLAILFASGTPSASANTSHAGWPAITGMLVMNKQDQARPLDARPGHDPFDGTDPLYSCDGLHVNSTCLPHLPFASPELNCTSTQTGLLRVLPSSVVDLLCTQPTTSTVPGGVGHNELLGGHGNDVIYAGPAGDVLWGDYKPSGQPTAQVDHLYGGPGNDFVYASHGTNVIHTGGGNDTVHAHFGHGSITCEAGHPVVYLSHRSRKRYHLRGCHRISYRTDGY